MKSKFKSFLAVLLSVIICFSAFPVSALADSWTYVNHFYRTTDGTNGVYTKETTLKNENSVSTDLKSTENEILYSYELNYTSIRNNLSDSYIKVDSKSDVIVRITFYTSYKERADELSPSNFGLYNYGGSYKHYGGTSTKSGIKTVKISDSRTEYAVTYTITFSDIDSGNYYFGLTFANNYKTVGSNPYYSVWSANNLRYNSISYQVISESSSFFKNIQEKLKGWFDNLFSWLQSIINNIKNGFSDVGTWFTNLTNNVKSFFSDLTSAIKTQFTNLTTKLSTFNDNIKKWFSDLVDNLSSWFTDLVNNIKAFLSKVGEWFSTLFDKLKQWFADVGQWFKDLWNNITNKVIEIRTDLYDWWESLFAPEEGFFESYKTSFDEFFKEHFGILYQVTQFLSDTLTAFSNAFNRAPDGTIEYSALKLPAKLFGKEYTILSGGKFSFDSLINSDDTGQLSEIHDIIYVLTDVLIYIALFLRAKKIFEMIITNGEGVEE